MSDDTPPEVELSREPGPGLTDESIDELLKKLDSVSFTCDCDGYGLPIGQPHMVAKMRSVVRAWYQSLNSQGNP